jgi:hypothetical protein
MKQTKKTLNLAMATLALVAGLAGPAAAMPIRTGGGGCDGYKYRVNGLITISCNDYTDCTVLGGDVVVINHQPYCCTADDLGQYDCQQLNQIIDARTVDPSVVTRFNYQFGGTVLDW